MMNLAKQTGLLQLLGTDQLGQLLKQADTSPRKRSHLLLHAGPDDQVQRLLIAAQPGTYIRPHQHSQQWEMLALQSGRVEIVIFDETGTMLVRETLDRSSPVVQIPVPAWHSCIVIEPAVLLEVKPGPFRPNEFADWAPEEGQQQAPEFLSWVTSAALGQRWKPE